MTSLPPRARTASHGDHPQLSARQGMVLRAVVAAYVGEGTPVGSATLSHLLPVSISSASVRNTMVELMDLGLIDKPHASSGRVPTQKGLRLFVDQFLRRRDLADYEKRDLAGSVEQAGDDEVMRVASLLLSEHTHQLGFVLPPRLDRLVLRHVTLVRLSADRILTVLVSETGQARRRVLDGDVPTQLELERMSALLNERVLGRTLREVRDALVAEAEVLRSRADDLLRRALELGARALEPDGSRVSDLVIATHLSLLDQPEFQDPERLRRLFAALETKSLLLSILDRMLEQGLSVAFGDEVGEPDLSDCALVVAPYGPEGAPLGALGVIGPSRMDFARVISCVGFLSQLVSEKLTA